MSELFGNRYADIYDTLYKQKDYNGEIDLIERILNQEGITKPCRVLDLGCGTGTHAMLLAERGYHVMGIDRSPHMVARARAKAEALSNASISLRFQVGDIRDVNLGEKFDVIIMMFAVLCYQHEDRDVLATLATVRRHLRDGGLFIFDVWNGQAVIADQPRERELILTDAARRIIRKTKPRLDIGRHLCHITFALESVALDGGITHWDEEHVVRFYFCNELRRLLHQCDLRLITLRSFPSGNTPVMASDWNMIGIADAHLSSNI